MSDYQYIEYSYPVPYVFEKILVWISQDCNCYFALKEKIGDSWSYYAGKDDASHTLNTGMKLVSHASEALAQTNDLLTSRDASDKVLVVLPNLVVAKYVRIYISDFTATTVHEFKPSIRMIADELIGGTLLITDELTESPSIKITVSSNERVLIGDLGSDVYGMRGKDSSGNIIFQIDSGSDHPYVEHYADHYAIELELMKMNFQQISWAQFAIFDAFDDETKRVDPDPSTHDARVYRSSIDNGEDDTADREFGFVSIEYANITSFESGTSTSVGLNFLTDTNKSWFTNEVKNATLVDSGANEFTITSNTSDTLTVSGTPDSGAYTIKDDNPQYAVAFCSFVDSVVGGGNGYVKLEVSFDGGSHYQTFLDTESSIDLRSATVAITYPGNDYIARITLKNDGSGNGPIVYKFLVCTDPSPWRF